MARVTGCGEGEVCGTAVPPARAAAVISVASQRQLLLILKRLNSFCMMRLFHLGIFQAYLGNSSISVC